MFNTNTVSTLEYMSPETLSNSVYLKQSDVYSFAILAFEFLSESDFTNMSQFQHIDAITNKKYRPSMEGIVAPDELMGLVEAAWDDDWRVRPSMAVICQILLRIKTRLGETNGSHAIKNETN